MGNSTTSDSPRPLGVHPEIQRHASACCSAAVQAQSASPPLSGIMEISENNLVLLSRCHETADRILNQLIPALDGTEAGQPVPVSRGKQTELAIHALQNKLDRIDQLTSAL